MLASILQDSTLPDASQQLHESLDELLREATASGIPQNDAIKAIMAWAVDQAYATGGYPHTRIVVLDVLEHILLHDMTNKNTR
jgi:hypothetical protein